MNEIEVIAWLERINDDDRLFTRTKIRRWSDRRRS
jgi:hypothetical protein